MQGRAGQDRTGQDRAGQGRAGQDRGREDIETLIQSPDLIAATNHYNIYWGH